MPQQIDINSLNDVGSKEKIQHFNKEVKSGKHIFLFTFLEGCHPCNKTKDEWKLLNEAMLTNDKFVNNNDIVIAQINKDVFNKLHNVGLFPSNGFPSLRYIKKNGNRVFIQEYENSGIIPLERTSESFTKWIASKVQKHTNKSRINKKNKTNKTNKKNRKPRKTVSYGGKTRKSRRSRRSSR